MTDIRGIINIIGSSLSVLGAGFVLLVFILAKCQGMSLENISKLILFLSVADFFGALSIVISQAYIFSSDNSFSLVFFFFFFFSKTQSNFLQKCIAFRALIQFFFTASFLWLKKNIILKT